VTPPGVGGLAIATKIIYAVTAVLVLCSVSMAAQHMFFDVSPKADEQQVVESTSATTAGGVARRPARPNAGQARDESAEPEAPEPAREPLRRGPAIPREPSPASGARDASQPTEAVGAQVGQAADRGSWSLVSAVANVLSLGSGGASTAPAPATPNTPRASLSSTGGQVVDVYFGTDEGTVCQAGTREFELTAVADLYVCVAWRGLSGKYAEQLTFVLPDGNVYQTMTVPFMTIDMPPTADPMIDIGGRKLEAKRAGWGANGVALVTAALPVSGTFITQYRLAGVWTVQVGLDGRRIDHNNFELLTP
jgi:hypothetical protein